MAVPLIQSSFAAGELAPGLFGRVDLEKYKAGAAMMRNFFVDYRGGASTRPGTQYVGPVKSQAGAARLIPFQFSTSQAYILVLDAANTCRVISNGGYVLETAFAITGVMYTSNLNIYIPGHNFIPGDEIYFSGIFGCTRPNGISGINGRTLVVTLAAAGVIAVDDPINPGTLTFSSWSAYSSGGSAARIYTFATPWNAADLFALTYTQSADVLTVCHPNYAVQNVNRYGTTNWTVTPVVFGASINSPVTITGTPENNAGGTQFDYVYAVTSINAAGEESNPTSVCSVTNSALNQNTGVCNNLTWTPVTGATSYRVYRNSTTLNSVPATPPYFFGFIQETTNMSWQDQNYAPDYATVPPTGTSPFAYGPIIAPVTIENAGFGYRSPVVSIMDGFGTGAVITITENTGGGIATAVLTAGGTDYASPSINIVESAPTLGTGATMAWSGAYTGGSGFYGGTFVPAPGSITLSGAGSGYHIAYVVMKFVGGSGVSNPGYALVKTTSGVLTTGGIVILTQPSFTGGSFTGITMSFTIVDVLPGDSRAPGSGALLSAQVAAQQQPGAVAYFEQRKVYAAPPTQPDTFFASRPGQYNNFDISLPSQEDDAITGTIVSDEVNAITSLTSMQSGLIALTSNGAYLISGGQPGAAFTPATAVAQSQAFSGAAPLRPLKINYDLLYLQSRGSAVRDLAYNFYVNVYTGQDISALSSHLFSGRTIVDWGYAEEPLYVVWAIRDDGILLSLTYLKEQEIYGWARHDTQGAFVSVAVITEGGRDAPYFVVRRFLNGQFFYTVERMAPRLFGSNSAQNTPSDASQAWCVDAGVQYPQIFPNATLTLAPAYEQDGALGAGLIIAGGTGYTAPTIHLSDPTGTGAVISFAVTGGVISSFTISGGTGYTSPSFRITDATGSGAILSASIQNYLVFQADMPVFSSGVSAGMVLRAAGGVGTVQAVLSSGQLFVLMTKPPSGLLPNNPNTGKEIFPQPPGSWSLSTPVSVVGGLDHLSGCTVSIVADGAVVPPQAVVDGCITLPSAASAITVGQGYSCQLQTLRVDAGTPTLQGQRKSIPAVTVRAQDTRGIFVGPKFNMLTEMKEREYENWGQPIAFQTEGGASASPISGGPSAMMPLAYPDRRTIVENDINEDGQICVLQTYPLPATILAEVLEIDAGDQPSQ